MQIRVARLSRVERTTTSCGECRRRKQRCNQGQPCSNCARRFPVPRCEYKTTSGSNSGRGPDGTTFLVSALPSTFTEDDSIEYDGIRRPLLPIRPAGSEYVGFGPDAPSWTDRRGSGFDDGELVRWSGIDILTQFPGSASWEALPWMSASSAAGPSGGIRLPGEALPLFSSNFTVPSDAIQDALVVLQVRHDIPNRLVGANWNPGRSQEIVAWLMTLDASARMTGPPRQPSGSTNALSALPIAATRHNAELLQIFVKLISRFKACLDGNPDPNNPYIKFYVPFCVQTPLLAQVAIYTASCFLNETGHLDKTVVMAHKGLAIRMLNDMLRSSKASCSDEAVTAVIQLILDEWYWGDTNDLRAHLRGLREMIRLRGGLRCLGMNGLVGKLAVAADVAIALSFEVPPFLQKGTELDSVNEHPSTAGGGVGHLPFRVAFNTPLVSPLVPFSACAEALAIHPVTASILDDMRFLISRVMGMPTDPSPTELKKLHTTAAWMFGRIEKLPVNSPTDGMSPAAGSADGGDGGKLKVEASSSTSASSSRGARSKSTSPSTAGEGSSSSSHSRHHHQLTPEPPDFLYQAVRQAALIYCRAVMQRRPFSLVIGNADFCQLWTTMWRVSLTKWKSMVGVFGWIMVCIASCTRDTPHDRFVKSMLTISAVQSSLENWEIASGALRAALRLQAWLGADRVDDDGGAGGCGSGGAGSVSGGEEERKMTPPAEGGAGLGDDGSSSTLKRESLSVGASGTPDEVSRRSSPARSVGSGGGGEEAVLAGPAEPDVSSKVIGGERNIREQGSVIPEW